MRCTILVLGLAAAGLGACAEGGGGGYAAPNWTRDFCRSLNWRLQGQSDARRFEDAERRLAALDRSCGIHMLVPRDEYLAGFASGG